MLDLDVVFDPDIIEANVCERYGTPALYSPIDVPSIGPDDLPGDWRCVFEERAAIMEYHGELPRELAEAKALTETVQMMENEKN